MSDADTLKLIGQLQFIRDYECKTDDEIKAMCKTIAVLSAQPERKTGRWERHYSRPNVYADLWWHCSVCGYKNDDQYANCYHHYCPHCGAKMEGEG